MLWTDVYVAMAHALAATDRIVVGAGVTNPVTRHDTVTASVHVTLEKMHPGRVYLGIGRGNTACRAIGIPPVPLPEFRRKVLEIQALMRGEAVETGGRQASIAFADSDVIPTMIPASGPKILRLAGALADSVQLDIGAHPDAVRWACRYIREGAEEAGRSFDDIEVGVCIAMFVDDDLDVAAASCRTLPGMVKGILKGTLRGNPGLELPAVLQRLVDVEGGGDYLKEALGAEAANNELPREIILEQAIAGSAETCLERIRELAAIGIDEIAIMTHDLPSEVQIEQMRRIGREILPIAHELSPGPWAEAGEALPS
jgi:5,10-methylenetetrahydromethanopterin reductase